jgi:hypothetical protein
VISKNSTVGISSIISNISYLEKLKFAMKDFAKSKSFASFDYLKNNELVSVFEQCYNRLSQ